MDKQKDASDLRPGDIPSGSCKLGKVEGKEIAIFNVDGQLYATQAECAHMGGPLCEGALLGDIVTCPWHGSEFNVRTGEVVNGLATQPIKTYPVSMEGGSVVICDA